MEIKGQITNTLSRRGRGLIKVYCPYKVLKLCMGKSLRWGEEVVVFVSEIDKNESA